MQSQATQQRKARQQEPHDHWREDQAEVYPLDQPSMALVTATGPERLRDQGIQAQQQAQPEDGHREIQHVPDTDGPDGLGPQPTDEDRVDDPHRHPAQLAGNHRPGQAQGGPQLHPESPPDALHDNRPPISSQRSDTRDSTDPASAGLDHTANPDRPALDTARRHAVRTLRERRPGPTMLDFPDVVCQSIQRSLLWLTEPSDIRLTSPKVRDQTRRRSPFVQATWPTRGRSTARPDPRGPRS